MKIEKIRVGVVGEYQSGKSLLINCLLRQPIATIGEGDSTTHTIVSYFYAEEVKKEKVVLFDCKGEVVETLNIERFKTCGLPDTDFAIKRIDVYLNNQLLKDFVLVDMPGMGYSDEEDRIAEDAMKEIDYAILVESNTKAIGDRSLIYVETLERQRIPYYFILNCIERGRDIQGKKWHPTSPYNVNRAQRNRLQLTDCYKPMSFPFEEEEQLVVNLMWYWYSIQDEDDELLKKEEIQSAMVELRKYEKEIVKKISKFHLIEKIFSMENRMYLELKKEIKEEIQKLKDEVCPVGTIQAFAFNRIPDGWMICDGRWLLVLDYPELFGAIGHTFGKVDENHFKIPDLRGRFVRGWSKDGEIDKGRGFGTPQDHSFQEHSHRVSDCSSSGKHSHRAGYWESHVQEANTFYTTQKHKHLYDYDDKYKDGYKTTDSDGEHRHEITIGGPKGMNNNVLYSSETRPTNVALLYCIKVGTYREGEVFYDNVHESSTNNHFVEDEPVMPVSPELSLKDIMAALASKR